MSYPGSRAHPMKNLVARSLNSASRALGTRHPMPYVGDLIERTFYLPDDDISYANNRLTPGAVPYEPSFSESDPNTLRFTIAQLTQGPTGQVFYINRLQGPIDDP